MKGLNLGCGPIYLEHDQILWENSDLADTEAAQGWRLDRKRDFLDVSDVVSDTVDFIVAWHIVEHIPMHLFDDALKEWHRVLRPGGEIYIACPDVMRICRNIIEGKNPWNDWFICMVNLYGPYNGFSGDVHRWGYHRIEMVSRLLQAGFSQAGELDPGYLGGQIGRNNAQKLGFADYNLQVYGRK